MLILQYNTVYFIKIVKLYNILFRYLDGHVVLCVFPHIPGAVHDMSGTLQWPTGLWTTTCSVIMVHRPLFTLWTIVMTTHYTLFVAWASHLSNNSDWIPDRFFFTRRGTGSSIIIIIQKLPSTPPHGSSYHFSSV